VDFARSNPELIDYFFVIDDYSHEDLISFIGQNPLNPFKFMDKIEVFHSIHLKIEELSRRLINEEEVEGVTTVLYQSLAIQEIISNNEQKVKKYLTYRKALKNLF
jgi:hypothetical protein